MSSVKCPQCGLANFAADFECRRCQSSLRRQELFQLEVAAGPGRRSFVRWAIWIVGVTWLIVFIWSRSLVFTSEPLEMRKRWQVNDAIGVLERAGFSREVFILRHLTNYRATDSWWNVYQGHENAYASTNFPLEIVTLYPKFFEDAVDDTERAAILLHEGQHLLGLNEAEALERTWREKARIGWTRDRYGESKVFAATEETTFAGTSLFQCKENHHSDCIPPVVPVLSPRKTSSSIR